MFVVGEGSPGDPPVLLLQPGLQAVQRAKMLIPSILQNQEKATALEFGDDLGWYRDIRAFYWSCAGIV